MLFIKHDLFPFIFLLSNSFSFYNFQLKDSYFLVSDLNFRAINQKKIRVIRKVGMLETF